MFKNPLKKLWSKTQNVIDNNKMLSNVFDATMNLGLMHMASGIIHTLTNLLFGKIIERKFKSDPRVIAGVNALTGLLFMVGTNKTEEFVYAYLEGKAEEEGKKAEDMEVPEWIYLLKGAQVGFAYQSVNDSFDSIDVKDLFQRLIGPERTEKLFGIAREIKQADEASGKVLTINNPERQLSRSQKKKLREERKAQNNGKL